MCCGQLKSDSLKDIDAASKSDLAPLDTAFWSQAQEELSSQGLRVLALCRCAVLQLHSAGCSTLRLLTSCYWTGSQRGSVDARTATLQGVVIVT